MSDARLARALRQANKVEKLSLDLGTARVAVSIATLGLSVTVLDKSTGAFTLTFVFADASTASFTNAELTNGDILDFEFAALTLTNTAQADVTLKLLVDKRV